MRIFPGTFAVLLTHGKRPVYTPVHIRVVPPTTPQHHARKHRSHERYNQDRRNVHTKSNNATVWTTLITNNAYLPGLLTLEYSLRKTNSKYPLLVLYTDSFPADGHAALDARGIMKRQVSYLAPSVRKGYTNDPRFNDCWSKLTQFSLVEYERVVQLDSDMVVLQNMDELMDIELDPPAMGGNGNRVFATSHACVCNPLKKPHYPEYWCAFPSNKQTTATNFYTLSRIPSNCAFTSQHSTPDEAQTTGAPCTFGTGESNSGLQVINPSQAIYDKITSHLDQASTSNYHFADQSLVSDIFRGQWVPLPYVYNALKTLRRKGVHDAIWRDENVKNVHYILSPKPWEEVEEESNDETHVWWKDVNAERVRAELGMGVKDGFQVTYR